MVQRVQQLNRYTDLTALIDILTKKRLVLLDPDSWNDKNDVYFLSSYKDKCQLNTLLALCFTTKYETYHHWSVFAPNSSGVCIKFHKKLLIQSFNKVDGVRAQGVLYKEISDLKDSNIQLEDIPFLKRYPYKDEEEYRAIYESNKEEVVKEVPFDLSVIDRIVLSPWLPEPLFKTIRDTIKNIEGCSNINVYKTTLLSNARWKDYMETLV